MPGSSEQGDLFVEQVPDVVAGTVVINGRCTLRTDAHHRAVLVAGLPLAHFGLGDRMAEAYAMVSLVEQGWADQNEVACAFGCSTRTLRRHQERFGQGGLAALGRRDGYPVGRARVHASREKLVHRLRSSGVSNRAIAKHIGVTENAVRKLLRRQGWQRQEAVESADLPFESTSKGAHPNLSAFPVTGAAVAKAPVEVTSTSQPNQASKASRGAHPNLSAFAKAEPLPISSDTDPSDRRMDRLFAHLGILKDAAPLFRAGPRVPRGGVLLAIPLLVHSGVIECAEEVYGDIGPAFYGLRTTIVALIVLALLRIKRPEALKEHAPDDLGRLLGLDRAPEVKTLRRKLARLSKPGFATAFGRALAQKRVALRGEALGFLYVDGHVRVYHGERVIPKAHVAQMRLCVPATTDYWINDQDAEPLFVLTAEANDGLVKMLPPILAEVRRLIGKRRITIVFDRGGWSPKLFRTILADGFDILTYRKAKFRKVPRRCFKLRRAVFDGRKVSYRLADRQIRLLKGKLRLRQVTQLSENGHQTPIVTSRQDIRDVEVAFRMFERWRQENYFKYLREEYALDALSDHLAEPADPGREVPNPKLKKLALELRVLRAEIVHLAMQVGIKALGNVEALRRTMRGFKIANAADARKLDAAVERHVKLESRRASLPKRVPVKQVVKGKVVQLAAERKHLTNVVKMVAYQIESDLVRLVAPHYKRADQEGRTLVQTALASAADIEVTKDELRITLAPQSSLHRTKVVKALCEEMNRTEVSFPGTKLGMRFGVAEPARGLAAMASGPPSAPESGQF
jgi:hypothetical protein